MIDFIIQYWVEVLLGLVVTIIGFAAKHHYNLYRKEQEEERKRYYETLKSDIVAENSKIVDQIVEKSKEEDGKLQKQINSITQELSPLKAGILSLQGEKFKKDCRRLLKEDREITLEEWEEIDSEHRVYNSLGGNHNGDMLYEAVKKKWESTIS